jgi:large subunit ribosomal protein L23
MDFRQVIVAPIITEKAVGNKVLSRYVFKVLPQATKKDICIAVESMFKVKVTAVNTLKVRAKNRRRGYQVGKTSRWKKAYVTLSAGQKIEELEV